MADEETKPADAEKEEPKAEAAEAPPAEEKPAEAPAAEEAKPAAAEEAKPAAEEGSKEGAPREEKRERTAADVLLELEGGEEASKPKILKAKGSKNIHTGIVHIRATFNNTSVTISDQKGNVIGWSTSGKMGFRGSRKSTAYAAQVVSQDACRQAMSHGLKEAEVRVKGPGAGRESAVRAIQNMGVEILAIRDVTPVPHNGCRPPKARRV
ncbi:MAG: 30S ribosomal protein S11 [Verrucomicrobiota bacterium]